MTSSRRLNLGRLAPNNMRRLLTIIGVLSVLAVSASTDGKRLLRRTGCVEQTATRADATRGIVSSLLKGDVCIPIILAAYSDVDFTIPDVQQVWDAMANQPGYSDHGAYGCMAEYFLEQSYGQFRVTFDVLGPVTLPQRRSYYGKGDDGMINTMIFDACTLAAALPGADFSRYDWNGDGTVEAVLVVYAGIGENVLGAPSDVVWPKQGYVSSYSAGGMRLNTYACSNELVYPNNRQEGFGTLLHEFSHCLGLPDLYNTDNSVNDYIIFDEWDLMDGGCYAADGWGPVSYSAYERMLCGWLQPEELTAETEISAFRPLNDGGGAYLIRNDANSDEFFLLENRQQTGFDYYLPGHGLLVTHVGQYRPGSLFPNYGSSILVQPVPADDLEFRWSYKKYVQDYYGVTLPDNQLNIDSKYKGYQYDDIGRSRLMTGTAYPYVADDVVLNDELTDTSTPAATLRYANTSGEKLLSKPITGIREDDGLISFRFMAPPSAVSSLPGERTIVAVYDLYGRRYPCLPVSLNSLYIIRYCDGTTEKLWR